MRYDDMFDLPHSPSWTLARRAFAGLTDEGAWRPDLVDYAIDNVTDEQVIVGVPHTGLRVTIALLAGSSPMWLGSFYDEEGRMEVAFLFADEITARSWAALLIVEELDEWDRDETLPGWPVPLRLQSQG